MDGTFDFAVAARHTCFAVGIVFAVYLHHVAVVVFLAACAFHDVSAFQTHFLSRSHTEIFLRGIFHEVVAFYPQFAAEFDGVCACRRIFRVVDSFHFLHLSFGIVGNDQLHRIDDCRYTGGTAVQVLADSAFQQGEVIQGIVSGITYLVYKFADGLGRVAATAETAESRHTGVVPTVYQMFFYQNQQVTLAHQGVVQVQFVELILVRTVVVQIFTLFYPVHEQVVQRTVGYELQGTQRMGHSFKVVALSVCEVIHGVCFPGFACTVVRSLYHTINNRVAEVHVGACHVYFGTEHHFAFFYITAVHFVEQFQAFLDGTVAVRALGSGLGGSAFLCRDLFGVLFVYISLSFLYQIDGEIP